MKFTTALYNTAVSFKQNEAGSILPTAAVLMTTLILAGGAALDYSRLANTKTVMDTALDAAILDAGVRLGMGQAVDQQFEEDFNAFFQLNVAGRGGFASEYTISNFSADPATGKVTATAQADVDMTLMQLAGYGSIEAGTTSEAVFEQTQTEVAMMLDVTGSMGGSKIRALRSAAQDAVDILLPSGTQTRGTRVGIVPYASSVNAHRYASRASMGNDTPQIASTDAFFNSSLNVPTSACVTGRGGRDAATDTSYKSAPVGSDFRSVSNNNAFFRCPSAKIMPLTNDSAALKNEIAGFDANGYTAGHLGIAWSYYMLSPQWNDLWQDQSREAGAYGTGTTKVAILMTDGIFNTAYDGVGSDQNAPFNSAAARNRSQSLSAELCKNMKASGIKVYSIAFELNSNNARDLLDNCATDDVGSQQFFYEADNEDELRQAFRDIARNIQSLRLTQ